MATTVAAKKIGTPLITLTANVEEAVTFTDNIYGVDVISPASNSDAAWYTVDGSTPTVGGPNCYYLPPGCVDTRETAAPAGDPDKVRIISSGTPAIRVQQTTRGF